MMLRSSTSGRGHSATKPAAGSAGSSAASGSSHAARTHQTGTHRGTSRHIDMAVAGVSVLRDSLACLSARSSCAPTGPITLRSGARRRSTVVRVRAQPSASASDKPRAAAARVLCDGATLFFRRCRSAATAGSAGKASRTSAWPVTGRVWPPVSSLMDSTTRQPSSSSCSWHVPRCTRARRTFAGGRGKLAQRWRTRDEAEAVEGPACARLSACSCHGLWLWRGLTGRGAPCVSARRVVCAGPHVLG